MQKQKWIHSLHKLSNILFSDGCSFLIPYTLIYAAAWFTKAPIQIIWALFTLMHILNLALFILFIAKSKHSDKSYYILGIVGVFLVFMSNGVYLEFPSDTWEYVKYIFDYNALSDVRLDIYAPPNIRFTYFYSWTLIGDLPIEWRRHGLTFIASFWQTLLALQVYLLAKKIGSSTRIALLQTFATVALFGFANLSYFAYLSLSSTLASFTFYFRGLISMIDIARTRQLRAHILGLAVSVVGIGLSHTQGFILLIISALAIAFYSWFTTRDFNPTKNRLFIYTVISQALLIFGWYYMMIRQSGYRLYNVTFDDLPLIFKFNDIYSQTIGLHGLLNASLALIFLFRFPLMSILTLMPVFIVIFPPTLKAVRFILPYSIVSHRVLYALPACFLLVVGLDFIYKKIFKRSQIPQIIAIVLSLILISWPANEPWYGRFKNLVVSPPPELDFSILDPLPIWLEKNRNVSQTKCLYHSDRVTVSALAAHFRYGQVIARTATTSLWFNTVAAAEEYMAKPNHCGILAVENGKWPKSPASETNRILKHWSDDIANMKPLYPKLHYEVLEAAAKKNNWKQTHVPPFYLLYEQN